MSMTQQPKHLSYDYASIFQDASIEAFRQGYEAVRPLMAAEVSALPFCQMAQKIWLLGLRASYIHEWGEIHFSDRFVNAILDEIKTRFATVH